MKKIRVFIFFIWACSSMVSYAKGNIIKYRCAYRYLCHDLKTNMISVDGKFYKFEAEDFLYYFSYKDSMLINSIRQYDNDTTKNLTYNRFKKNRGNNSIVFSSKYSNHILIARVFTNIPPVSVKLDLDNLEKLGLGNCFHYLFYFKRNRIIKVSKMRIDF